MFNKSIREAEARGFEFEFSAFECVVYAPGKGYGESFSRTSSSWQAEVLAYIRSH